MKKANFEYRGVSYEMREQSGQFQFYVEYQSEYLHRFTSEWYNGTNSEDLTPEKAAHKAARWLIDCYI